MAAFLKEKITSLGFLKGELSPLENPCSKQPTESTGNFTGTAYYFELTFLENVALQIPGNSGVLKHTPFKLLLVVQHLNYSAHRALMPIFFSMEVQWYPK